MEVTGTRSDRTVSVIFFLLLPFFITVSTFYGIVVDPTNQNKANNTQGAVVFTKILILLLLCSYVLTSCYAFQIEWKFCTGIAVGLVFSSLGDGLSLYDGTLPNAFLYSLLLYGISHIVYIYSFGFTPIMPITGFLIALPFIGVLMVIVPKVDLPVSACVICYNIVDVLLVWRIIAKVSRHSGPLTISILMTTTGVIALTVSDTILIYDRYHSLIKFSSALIPLLYYIGQLGISSSVFNLPHELRPRDPNMHISGDECYEQLCHGCPFP